MMKSADELMRENEALRTRIASLSGAVLRISASLDVDTVLKEIADNARALTGARYAMITVFDDAGQVDYVASGITAERVREMAEWPDGVRLFEQLRKLPSPVRLSNLSAYVSSLGFSTDFISADTFLGTSIRHRDAQTGAFFLGGKEGGQEFTEEDEEMLVLFAAQAATAIANARTYRAERRARANLEALIDTSPVGVVVIDARAGRLVSVNREARRMVAGLLDPGQTEDELLQVVTFRLADGQEIALGEFPLAGLLNDAATLRAEEVELSVGDGRSVTMLINATPIKIEGEAVQTLVVTMQDLGPLEELERQRAEFLGMVSHELRAPLSSVKGLAATVLADSRVVDPAEVRQFFRIIDQQADYMDRLIRDLLDVGRIDSGSLSVDPEPAEVAALVDQARNTFVSGGSRHVLHVDLPDDLPEVMADERRIVQVLNNLLSNAARNSPESAPIRVAAVRDGTEVVISVSDEGRGVAPEQLPHLFRKHAAGGGEGAREQGAGLGLAICKGLVEAHGGRIRAESAGPGRGDAVHVHASGGRRDDRRRPAAGAAAARWRGAHEHSGGGRRPADAALRAGRAHHGRLRAGGDGRSAGGVAPAQYRKAPIGGARPGVAGNGWHRVDGVDAGAGGHSGGVSVGVRTGGDDREGVGGGSGGLHREAVLADGADGASAGGAAQAKEAGSVRGSGPGNRLRQAHRERGRTAGAADGDGIRVAAGAVGERGPGNDLRVTAEADLGGPGGYRYRTGADVREEAAREARRRPGEPEVHLQRARGGLPHGCTGGPVGSAPLLTHRGGVIR